MLMRSGTGRIWRSRSRDGGANWTAAEAVDSLLNPNSKIAAVALPGSGRSLVLLAYNPSETKRAPLHLAASFDGGATFNLPGVAVEEDPEGNFAYPTVVGGDGECALVSYSVWGRGLRIARVPLSLLM